MTYLSYHHLTTRLGPATALDDCTALVKSGRVTAFLGSSESGKAVTVALPARLSP